MTHASPRHESRAGTFRASCERRHDVEERYRCSDSSMSTDARHSNATAAGTTSPSCPATRPSPIRSPPSPAIASCTRSTNAAPPRRPDGLIAEAVLGAPIPQPRQVFGIGLNYRDHAGESGRAAATRAAHVHEVPQLHRRPDRRRSALGRNGRLGGRDRRRDRRRDKRTSAWPMRGTVVAGLTLGQDISDRAVQMTGTPPQFCLGKSFANYGPTGPGAGVDRRVRRPRRHRAVVRRRRRTHASRTHDRAHLLHPHARRVPLVDLSALSRRPDLHGHAVRCRHGTRPLPRRRAKRSSPAPTSSASSATHAGPAPAPGPLSTSDGETTGRRRGTAHATGNN